MRGEGKKKLERAQGGGVKRNGRVRGLAQNRGASGFVSQAKKPPPCGGGFFEGAKQGFTRAFDG